MEMIFVIFLIVIGIYYIYLSTQTAFLAEDEATYFSLGKELSNLQYPTTDSSNNAITAPLFIPLLYSALFMILGASLILAKVITAIFGILTLIVVYLIGKKINFYVGIFSVFILLSITLFTQFMLIAYVDVPIAFFSALSVYMISRIDSKKSSILAGLVIGISYFVKETGLFIALTLLLYSFYVYFFQKNRNQFKLYLTSSLISLLLIAIVVIRNIALFGYPYLIILNIFFTPPSSPSWITAAEISPSISTISDFAGIFSWIPLILGIFSIFYILSQWKKIESKSLSFSFVLFCLFIISFVFLYSIGRAIAEARYFIVIFPQLALISGFFLWKLKENSNLFLIIIIPIILFGVYSSIFTAIGTSQSTRFPTNYINALNWLKSNTPQDSIIFTTYGGSVKYFAERNQIWSVKEFPDIMTSSDPTYIYDTLEKYNVSYILVWNGVISQDYIIPGSNIAGVFTYNFLNTISNDTEHFNTTYQNQDDIIFQLI